MPQHPSPAGRPVVEVFPLGDANDRQAQPLPIGHRAGCRAEPRRTGRLVDELARISARVGRYAAPFRKPCLVGGFAGVPARGVRCFVKGFNHAQRLRACALAIIERGQTSEVTFPPSPNPPCPPCPSAASPAASSPRWSLLPSAAPASSSARSVPRQPPAPAAPPPATRP
jgi:hypothetical protein